MSEVQSDLSISVALGPNLGGSNQQQAALDERLPRQGTGVLRTQGDLPTELLLITNPDEAERLVQAGQGLTSNDGEPVRYEAQPVSRDSAEFLVAATGIHWAIVTFKRPLQEDSASETPQPADLTPES